MATFKFNALDYSGQEIVDDIEASTKEEAVTKVRSLGYFPTKVQEHPPSLKVAKGQQPSSGLPRIGRGWKCPNPLSWFPKIELPTIDVNSVVIVGEFVIIVFLLILLLVKW